MELSPEEKRRIYEEEKARIEAEEKLSKEKRASEGASSTNLEPNVGGLLCYLGMWITGIIFLIIEQKNRLIRFHAIQSIIVFGFLFIASAILNKIPFVGWFFGLVIGMVIFILWIVLMVKAYQGEVYKLPLAGDIAEKVANVSADKGKEFEGSADKTAYTQPVAEQAAPPEPVVVEKRPGERADEYVKSTRGGRMTASSFAIAWSFVLLIFFNYFTKYIAYYQLEGNRWIRYPILTGDFNAWLPILTITLTLSIVGHIILIIYDRYILRETTLIVLNLFGIAVTVTLLSIYPFDFHAVPNDTAVTIVSILITVVLIGITIGLLIGTIVSFIRLIVNLAKGTANY